MRPLINIDELGFHSQTHGDKFAAHMAPIASRIGASKLGCRLTIVPPGKKAWPYHAHLVNEEMFFVLEGNGTLKLSGTTYPLRAGDVVCCVADKDAAHEIFNDSSTDLKYLAISTMLEPDVVLYPDSKKLGVIAGRPPGRSAGDTTLKIFAPSDCGVDYWEGE
ncbi:MAG: cupin domain-containing protein [Gammaproteobacteria bacterium]|nr:cupin domain-containing protein [Gammaproteobacteria bacterium]